MKIKTIIIILGTILLIAGSGALVFFNYCLPLEKYNMAASNENEFDLYTAIDLYGEVLEFKDSREKVEELAKYLFDENYHIQFDLTVRIDDDGELTWKYVDEESYDKEKSNIENWSNVKDVALFVFADRNGSFEDTFFALLNNGVVIHTPLNVPNENREDFNVNLSFIRADEKEFVDSEWNNIQKISNSLSHIVGLKEDGTVVSAGDNSTGQCETDSWSDIVDIATGDGFTAGLKKNGRVVLAVNDTRRNFVWRDKKGEIKEIDSFENAQLLKSVHLWKDVKKISADINHLVGLTEDGKVVVAGQNRYGQLNIGDWTDIVDIYATEMTTFALDKDGKIHYTIRKE